MRRFRPPSTGIRLLARQGRNPLVGALRLGAIYTIGPYLLPRLIPLVMDQAPEMPLLIEENATSVLCERLKRGELDVVIISLPFDEAGILTRSLYEPFAVLVPGTHPLSRRDAVEITDLGRENVLLLGPGHCFRDQVLQACPQCLQSSTSNGILQRSLEGGSLETIRYMVASGVGITVLPCTAALAERFSSDMVRVCLFAGAAPRRRVALAWRKSFPRPEVVDVLSQAIRQADLACVSYLEGLR